MIKAGFPEHRCPDRVKIFQSSENWKTYEILQHHAQMVYTRAIAVDDAAEEAEAAAAAEAAKGKKGKKK